jgi:hypothetical protein
MLAQNRGLPISFILYYHATSHITPFTIATAMFEFMLASYLIEWASLPPAIWVWMPQRKQVEELLRELQCPLQHHSYWLSCWASLRLAGMAGLS